VRWGERGSEMRKSRHTAEQTETNEEGVKGE
jgi:hypothetical protein